MHRRRLRLAILVWLGCWTAGALLAQPAQEPSSQEVPQQVEVDPVAEDRSHRGRLSRILEATGWFQNTAVRVDEGAAFLSGRTDDDRHRQWAGQLARNTQGVVALVNRIEVADYKGYVQSVNMRSTLLMTLEGNHVQIPNAAVYKGTITNFTANPNARFEFSVGIGYDDSISEAQQVAARVLGDHPAVVDDPEPLVLVEALGAATVNLRVYFWVDISRYSGIKVGSAVIRMTKSAFEQAGISMPDEAREVVFPEGVPVQMTSSQEPQAVPKTQEKLPLPDKTLAAPSEGDLTSEAPEIEEQARKSRPPEGVQNLLEPEG